MSLSTISLVVIASALFAGFATMLAWGQLHVRRLQTEAAPPAGINRPRRRPF